jgi:hypothetical protein
MRPLLLITILFLAGCGSILRPAPGSDESLIIGYNLPCYGYVMPEVERGASSYITVKSGPQIIKLRAANEPDYSDAFFHDSYECSYVSTHEVRFDAKPGKSYRLHLESESPGKYSITVWEGLDRFADQTQKIEAVSNQTSISKECRYYIRCEQWPNG